jgi:hypothetical protein
MKAENKVVQNNITTSDDAIEVHVNVFCTMIKAAGEVPTELHIHSYRESLRSLVRLARSEYALAVSRDMEQANAAIKGY